MDSKQLEAIQLIQFDMVLLWQERNCNEKLWHGLLSVFIQDQINDINGCFFTVFYFYILDFPLLVPA